MTRERTWTLARRITLGFAVTTAVLAVTICAVSAWYLREQVARENEQLVLEELDEMRALFVGASERSPELVRSIAADIAPLHPENRFAWRVWRPGDAQPWVVAGDAELLARIDGLGEHSAADADLGDDVLWHVEPLRLGANDTGLWVGLAMDASVASALLARFELSALAAVVFASLLAGVAGAVFARHTSGLLRRVADEVREVRRPEQPLRLIPKGAPREIRDVAEALRTMLANIREEAERNRLLTAGLAHELRSPITTLLGEAEVALLRPRQPAEYRAILESQVEELRDLGRVVDNLVVLCAQQTANGNRNLERFDLGRETELRLERSLAEARRRGVTLELTQRGDLALAGDREALCLAVRNLVSNAVQWSPPEGRVRIALEGESDSVRVTVDDQGPGVPAEARERIFEPFFRGPQVQGRRAGYGLGLALTRTAVRAHGGRVEVVDAPGGGARFRLELPRGAGDPPSAPRAA
jgi:signal transduction histidine kinase